MACGRSPSGERGLKFVREQWPERVDESLPIRGAWIEIPTTRTGGFFMPGRSPSGERGLKSRYEASVRTGPKVAPHPGSVD